MAAYRFTGVKKAPKANVEGCCEPLCGPTTCGTSTEVKDQSKDRD